MNRRFSIILLSVNLLAGCTVGPNFERPKSPTSSGYVAADELAGSKGAPAADIGQGPEFAWWKAFGSPQLDALVDTALRNNHSLAASNATLERARQQLAAVAGGRLPQVDARARVERQEVNLAGFGFDPAAFGSSGGNPVFNLYSVGGGVSYDLDLFGGKRRAIEQAAAQAESQLHQTEAAHLTIAGRVANQVLAIAAIRTRIATANELIAADQKTVDLTEARRRGGEGTLVEVLNVRSQLAQDRTQLPQLQQQLAEARDMLAVLLGISPADLGPTDFTLDSFTLPKDVPVTLPSELVHKRPDILQAEADLHAATAGLGVATARLYPDITLGATLAQGAPNLGDVLDAGFRGFDIFAGLTAPIFHGGTLKAEQRGAKAGVQVAAANYRQTVIEAFGQIADLLSSLGTDASLVDQQRQALSVAERSRDLSRKSYQVGNSGILQVLDTSRQYDQARSALVEARARQLRNVARLYVATAGGWTGDAPKQG
jgi:NodT family efflux transporter outer membrane factor (OMF) lipoprotein